MTERPGLVPESGDPNNPGRWLRPIQWDRCPVCRVACRVDITTSERRCNRCIARPRVLAATAIAAVCIVAGTILLLWAICG